MSKNNTHLLNEYLECKKRWKIKNKKKLTFKIIQCLWNDIKNRIQEIEVELINKNENNITPLDFKVNCLKYTYCLLSIFHLNQMKDREHI